MSFVFFLIIGGIILFIGLIVWTIYELKNAYELPPVDPKYKDSTFNE